MSVAYETAGKPTSLTRTSHSSETTAWMRTTITKVGAASRGKSGGSVLRYGSARKSDKSSASKILCCMSRARSCQGWGRA